MLLEFKPKYTFVLGVLGLCDGVQEIEGSVVKALKLDTRVVTHTFTCNQTSLVLDRNRHIRHEDHLENEFQTSELPENWVSS